MSIFSILKASKKAAKEHKAAEKQKEPDAVVIPYKHTPTHAAVDALSGAPSSWSRHDASKIKAQHKRRSEMVMSRTPSSLSTISFVNPSAAGPSSQPPPLPRSSSHSSFNPTWFDKVDGTIDSRQNKYRPQRGQSYHDSGIGPSPLGSKVQSEGTFSTNLHQASLSLSAFQAQIDNRLTSSLDASPVISSSNSTKSNNSSDILEIAVDSTGRPKPNRTRSKESGPQGTVFVQQDIFDRLHTSTSRKVGEAPILDGPAPRPRVRTSTPAVEQKQKKQRWSLLGKRNTAAVST
ncbi:uncharacterized protein RCO7_05528 [Rhynchosporium graminicola]|uniref:Uncharacterized protein n=1 Tax=Rhynchosporium graminicola TaxID=2792576 RepID=A0A1E1L2G3_9HELO|nr:uncharacterized protein RCO7_05528 [Rhynchosporium commune]